MEKKIKKIIIVLSLMFFVTPVSATVIFCPDHPQTGYENIDTYINNANGWYHGIFRCTPNNTESAIVQASKRSIEWYTMVSQCRDAGDLMMQRYGERAGLVQAYEILNPEEELPFTLASTEVDGVEMLTYQHRIGIQLPVREGYSLAGCLKKKDDFPTPMTPEEFAECEEAGLAIYNSRMDSHFITAQAVMTGLQTVIDRLDVDITNLKQQLKDAL